MSLIRTPDEPRKGLQNPSPPVVPRLNSRRIASATIEIDFRRLPSHSEGIHRAAFYAEYEAKKPAILTCIEWKTPDSGLEGRTYQA